MPRVYFYYFNLVKIAINLNINACASDKSFHPEPLFVIKFLIKFQIFILEYLKSLVLNPNPW